ncbi:MAG: hypothetical protein AAGI54_12695 [Planctomycetota bacterium]
MSLPFHVIVPTEVEAGYLRGLDTIVCGVGGDAVQTAVQRLATTPRPAVLAGFAGGLVDEMPVGSVVMPGELSCDGRPTVCAPSPASAEHRLITVDEVVTDAAGKRRLGETSGAHLADMEGHAFAEACEAAGRPWLVVRAVSDGVDHALPEPIGDWVTPEGRTRVSAAMKWAGFRPGRLAELSRLKARADKAGAALRAAVTRLAETWPPAASPD